MLTTIASLSLGTKLALAAAGATVAVCVVARARPSTIVRCGEDLGIGAAKAAAERARLSAEAAKRFGRSVRVEYRARQIDKLQAALEAEARVLRDMPADKRAELAATEAAIFARAEELKAAREGLKPEPVQPPAKPRRRASRSGSVATA